MMQNILVLLYEFNIILNFVLYANNTMESIIDLSESRRLAQKYEYRRYLFSHIPVDQRLVIISGARGTGKTTMLLQFLTQVSMGPAKAVYLNLDDVIFSTVSPVDFIDWYYKRGGLLVVLDEVHKYPGWSRALKTVYDRYPDLKIIATGSSSLQMEAGEADLSRRAVYLNINELSLREFAELRYNITIEKVSLKEILDLHSEISREISRKIKPLQLFEDYLRFGAYPLFNDGIEYYHSRLNRSVSAILETDLPALTNITYGTVVRIKKLLAVIAESAPFTPNILEMSARVGIARDLMYKYLNLLEKAGLIYMLRKVSGGNSIMTKPEKIFLHNPNMSHALTLNRAGKGTLRETFFLNQMSVQHRVNYPSSGDFIVEGQYVFEIGGKTKKGNQIRGVANSWIARDDIEHGAGNVIPLWLFGFTY